MITGPPGSGTTRIGATAFRSTRRTRVDGPWLSTRPTWRAVVSVTTSAARYVTAHPATGRGSVTKYGVSGVASYHNRPPAHPRRTATSSTRSATARGQMLGYGYNIAIDDRWRIVMYVRALQRSQSAPQADATPDEQAMLDQTKKPAAPAPSTASSACGRWRTRRAGSIAAGRFAGLAPESRSSRRAMLPPLRPVHRRRRSRRVVVEKGTNAPSHASTKLHLLQPIALLTQASVKEVVRRPRHPHERPSQHRPSPAAGTFRLGAHSIGHAFSASCRWSVSCSRPLVAR